MNEKAEQAKEKLLANPKVQQLMDNEKVQKAFQNKVLIYNIFVGLLFLLPLTSMILKSNCYASDRPDLFWPVKENATASEGYEIYNVGSKFRWIFFLGFLTYIGQLGVDKFELKNDAEKEDFSLPDRKRLQAKEMEKKIQYLQISFVVLRLLFFIWVMNNRYSHVGMVCCGDYEGLAVLKQKTTTNYLDSMDYTFYPFAGFIMKMFVIIFLLKFMWNGIKAVLDDTHLGQNVGNQNEDEEYGYKGRHLSPNRSRENSSWSESKHRNMIDGRESRSPYRAESTNSPNRSVSPAGGRMSALKKIGSKNADFEKKFQENMQKALKSKVDGRKFSNTKGGSKKKH